MRPWASRRSGRAEQYGSQPTSELWADEEPQPAGPWTRRGGARSSAAPLNEGAGFIQVRPCEKWGTFWPHFGPAAEGSGNGPALWRLPSHREKPRSWG